METLFDLCICILRRATDADTAVSEFQYHRIVDCLRYMATLPKIDPNIKKTILQKYGWPETYDPCGFDPCRIRFFLSFTHDDDTELKNILEDFDLARQEYDTNLPGNINKMILIPI